MKNVTKIAIALVILSGSLFKVSGQTLKERIDSTKIVKVYFFSHPIVHNPNKVKINSGTTCDKFKETTPLPVEYIDATKKVVDLLNKGFNTTVFVTGDIGTLPTSYGEIDWVKLNEPLTIQVHTSGEYTVYNAAMAGEATKLKNYLHVESSLWVYGIVKGKEKYFTGAKIADEATPSIKSTDCEKYDYFVKNFPANSLVEPFKISTDTKTKEFIGIEMAKYEKAMKKKK
jgi:hypothetical protein